MLFHSNRAIINGALLCLLTLLDFNCRYYQLSGVTCFAYPSGFFPRHSIFDSSRTSWSSVSGSDSFEQSLVLYSSFVKTDQGSCANPLSDRKKVAVLGCGGYTGSLVFGFLQRCAALSYQTGLIAPRCIGATADTAVRLNRFLGRTFCLAQADESFIKLTNLQDMNSIRQRLEGYHAIIVGLDDYYIQSRTVTGGTYEKSPNDKAWEIYWGSPKGSFYSSAEEEAAVEDVKRSIVCNFLRAAQLANIQHAVVITGMGNVQPLDVSHAINNNKTSNNKNNNEIAAVDTVLWNALIESGIPYTCLQINRQTTTVSDTPNYSFKKGIQRCPDITSVFSPLQPGSLAEDMSVPNSSLKQTVFTEDVAALCVQVLQSLDWNQSRTLLVSGSDDTDWSTLPGTKLRDDQQWVVNSGWLRRKLATVIE